MIKNHNKISILKTLFFFIWISFISIENGTTDILGSVSAPQTPDRLLGKADAPIVIIEYSSLTCDHCAKFHLEVLPYLKKQYIDPGYVQLIFREYPSDGIALRAFAICNIVPEEHYFDILELFYLKQQEWAKPSGFMDSMAKIGILFGLKRHQINSCVENESLLNRIIAKRVAAAQQHNVDRTPFFIVGNKEYPYFMDIKEWDVLLKELMKNIKNKEEI